ncbi:hypothetical protein B0T16DRAFT_205136 [Cercophora newfieldiana]|uniref:Protein N-terminal and lysine N-methyltransferase EFM7 n=1 Tax=Cercophora newfieldiana TaxID=92897 RepID=A0AA40CL19_9PEZI|nr:hypothetical protein B0T16DRAFT_205136 [Cercophora newfieldiana]
MTAAPGTPPAAGAPATDPSADPEAGFSLFDDPEDYYPPSPPPTTQQYLTTTNVPIALHLVGHSPLEAHHLWNGSRVVAAHFEANPSLVRDRTVLELGAGAGLPSIIAGALGARKAIVTDFPDPDLIENMRRNIRECTLLDPSLDRVIADGYVWGAPAERVLSHIQQEGQPPQKFDVVILADLLFRHSEHDHLLDSIEATMKVDEGSVAFVVFTSYRPWLQHKDLKFFELARERGFVVEKVLERKMERPLFENDPGDEEVRKTVTGWCVTWPREYVEGKVGWPVRKE